MLRKREQIKKNNCVRDAICYSSIEERSVNFWLPEPDKMAAFTRDVSME